MDNRQLAAAIVFIVAYLPLSFYAGRAIVTRLPRLRFVALFLFCTIRIGAQIAGTIFAVKLYDDFNALLAYLILGAEGFFALVLAQTYSVIGFEKVYLGGSWLDKAPPEGLTFRQRRRHNLRQPIWLFHQLLILPNVLVVVGSSLQSGALSATDPSQAASKLKAGRALRTTGAALFLAFAVSVAILVLNVISRARRQHKENTALWYVCAAAPFVIVRGAFGVLQSADLHYSYYAPENYTSDGLGPKLLVTEYVMGATCEWIAALCLIIANWKLTKPKAARGDAGDVEEQQLKQMTSQDQDDSHRVTTKPE